MNKPTIERITELQKEFGLTNAQNMVFNGQIWKFEGSVGRAAMDMVNAGLLYLGEERTQDYWGSTIPSRNDLKAGSNGTLENAQNFWMRVEEGDDEACEYANEFSNFMNVGIGGETGYR